MAILNKEAILSAVDLKKELVKVPEWGGEVYISMMTGEARDAWEQGLVGGKGANLENIRARLVSFTAVDEQGKRIFNNEDAVELGKKSATALERCVKVAQKLNRLTEEELDNLVKN
jgi:hypothetical protein